MFVRGRCWDIAFKKIAKKKLKKMAISWQRPTTNIKSDMVCVKLIEITEWMLI